DEDRWAMTDRELRDELLTLLGAGHESTAIALSWAFERILSNPPVAKRVEDELAWFDDGLGLEGLRRLPYLEATIKESQRMRPSFPNVAREVHSPVVIAGHELPAGTMVIPCILIAHQREGSYPEPEKFIPDRFLGKK